MPPEQRPTGAILMLLEDNGMFVILKGEMNIKFHLITLSFSFISGDQVGGQRLLPAPADHGRRAAARPAGDAGRRSRGILPGMTEVHRCLD